MDAVAWFILLLAPAMVFDFVAVWVDRKVHE